MFGNVYPKRLNLLTFVTGDCVSMALQKDINEWSSNACALLMNFIIYLKLLALIMNL